MNQSPKRILLVEDNKHLRELICLALELDSYLIEARGDGREAIDFLKENEVDLIILDLFMPVLDGKYVLHWLRNEKKSNTPVLVMTAMTDAKTLLNIMECGANYVMNKPLHMEQISTAINKLLDV